MTYLLALCLLTCLGNDSKAQFCCSKFGFQVVYEGKIVQVTDSAQASDWKVSYELIDRSSRKSVSTHEVGNPEGCYRVHLKPKHDFIITIEHGGEAMIIEARNFHYEYSVSYAMPAINFAPGHYLLLAESIDEYTKTEGGRTPSSQGEKSCFNAYSILPTTLLTKKKKK